MRSTCGGFLRRGPIAAAAAAALFAAAPAAAEWHGTRWNMTPDEVAAAMAGAAPLSRGSRGKRLGGKRIGNVGEYRMGTARFRSVYYYDAGGLAHIELQRRSGECREIAEALVARHGPPLAVSDQILFRLLIWHDRPEQNRIRLMVSPQAGVCNLNYERLSDYEAYDLSPTPRAPAGRGRRR
jgi:hypothetical protein